MHIQNARFTFLFVRTEDRYRKEVMVDESCAVLHIIDTSGMDEFSGMHDQWMREGKGFLLVYSIISNKSFDAITLLKDEILRTKDMEKVPMYASIVTIWQFIPRLFTSFVIKIFRVCSFFVVVIDSVLFKMPAVLFM